MKSLTPRLMDSPRLIDAEEGKYSVDTARSGYVGGYECGGVMWIWTLG